MECFVGHAINAATSLYKACPRWYFGLSISLRQNPDILVDHPTSDRLFANLFHDVIESHFILNLNLYRVSRPRSQTTLPPVVCKCE